MKTIKFVVLLILFLLIPLSAQAQMGDWLSKFRFDFGVQEDYTDNVDLSPTNTREDWITKIYAGIGFSTLRPVDRAPGQTGTGSSGKGSLGGRFELYFWVQLLREQYVR